jgi:hypothetical protein
MVGRVLILVLCACALVSVLGASALAGLRPNPANDPRLLNEPMDSYRYDYAERCRTKVPPGVRAMQRWLEDNVRGQTWSIIRCEPLGDGLSVHSEGRAIDWALDAKVRRERRTARRLIRTLLRADANGYAHALALRMGVQGLIYNCKQWYGNAKKLQPYSYCYKPNGKRRRNLNRTAAHMDHVHIELNSPGAREKTSFWQSPMAGATEPPPSGGTGGKRQAMRASKEMSIAPSALDTGQTSLASDAMR